MLASVAVIRRVGASAGRFFKTWLALRHPSKFVNQFDPAAQLPRPDYTPVLLFAGWSFAGLAALASLFAPSLQGQQLPPLASPVGFLPVAAVFCLLIMLFISVWDFALCVGSRWTSKRGTPPLGWMWEPLLYINIGLVSVTALAIFVAHALTPRPPDPISIARAAGDWTETLAYLLLLIFLLSVAVLVAVPPYINTRLVRRIWNGGFVWGICVPLVVWILTSAAIGWWYGPLLTPERMDDDLRLAWQRTSVISRTQAYHRLIMHSCGDLEDLKQLLRTVLPSSSPWHIPTELSELVKYDTEMDGYRFILEEEDQSGNCRVAAVPTDRLLGVSLVVPSQAVSTPGGFAISPIWGTKVVLPEPISPVLFLVVAALPAIGYFILWGLFALLGYAWLWSRKVRHFVAEKAGIG